MRINIVPSSVRNSRKKRTSHEQIIVLFVLVIVLLLICSMFVSIRQIRLFSKHWIIQTLLVLFVVQFTISNIDLFDASDIEIVEDLQEQSEKKELENIDFVLSMFQTGFLSKGLERTAFDAEFRIMTLHFQDTPTPPPDVM